MHKWRLGTLAAIIVAMIVAIITVAADPIPPKDLQAVSSSRRAESPVASLDAIAGNVTELLINVTTVTKSWAGYYGNITGTIILDDADNNSMYSWTITKPEGEIYASRAEVDFSSGNIVCANSTHVQDEEWNLGMNETDYDGVNETFEFDTHPAFSAGENNFPVDMCNYSVSTYVDDASDAARTFNETLLYDKTSSQIVYTALIAADADGFKSANELFDFQMVVAEDGHGNTDASQYYFYVEIY